MKISKSFEDNQFSCKCCDKINVSKELIERLQMATDISGLKFNIAVGYVCRNNSNEFSSYNEKGHLLGKAVDILIGNDHERYLIIYSLLSSGFKRIGVSKSTIHADVCDIGKPIIWFF